jgi:hypothetical protein
MESGLRGGGLSLRRDLRCLEGVSVVLFEVINVCPHVHVPEILRSLFSFLRPSPGRHWYERQAA